MSAATTDAPTGRPARRGQPLTALLVAATVLASVAGCANPRTAAVNSPSPSASASESASASGAPSASAGPSQGASATGHAVIAAYYVRTDPDRLWVEAEPHRVAVTGGGLAKAAFSAVVAGQPTDPALRTLAPVGTRVLGVSMHAPTVTVDLSGEVRHPALGAAAEAAFAQQLAQTASQFTGMSQVSLRVDGQPVTLLWGHINWARPIKADEFALTPVELSTPGYGATVAAGRLTVAGYANFVFEGVVSLELRNAAGQLVEHPSVQSRQDRHVAWSFTFRTLVGPGRWTITGFEVSAKDGHRIGASTRPLIVR